MMMMMVMMMVVVLVLVIGEAQGEDVVLLWRAEHHELGRGGWGGEDLCEYSCSVCGPEAEDGPGSDGYDPGSDESGVV